MNHAVCLIWQEIFLTNTIMTSHVDRLSWNPSGWQYISQVNHVMLERTYIWAVSRKKVPNVPSHCYSKRRMGVCGHAQPSFGMTLTFLHDTAHMISVAYRNSWPATLIWSVRSLLLELHLCKFWQCNKVDLGVDLGKGMTKYWGSEIHLVVSSEFGRLYSRTLI